VGHGAAAPDRPFPVGHDDRTWLPARDGIPHGGVARSSRHPNASYFTAWTSPDGAVTWDIDVLESGTYEVEVFYAVPAADVGAIVQMSFADETTTAWVADAHDPPIVGAAEDRAPRTESYTKAFRPMSLGMLRMDQRRASLRLAAPVVRGTQAWEVSGVLLTRR
jgi:hypothetical protein